MAERAWVKNAADPEQVKRAGRKERDREAVFLRSLKDAMTSPAVRLVMWELLSRARVFGSIYHASALIHYNAGRQDFGHELMAACLEADEELYLLMEREARARAKREAHEIDAAHTPRAEGVTHG